MSEPSSEQTPTESRLEQLKTAEAKMSEMKRNVDIAAEKLGFGDDRKADLMAVMYGGLIEDPFGKPSMHDVPGSADFMQASRNLLGDIRSKATLATALLGLPPERKFDVMNAIYDK